MRETPSRRITPCPCTERVVEVPGVSGWHIAMLAALNHQGILHHHFTLGPSISARLILFLDMLHSLPSPVEQMVGLEKPRCVLIWDHPSLYQAAPSLIIQCLVTVGRVQVYSAQDINNNASCQFTHQRQTQLITILYSMDV